MHLTDKTSNHVILLFSVDEEERFVVMTKLQIKSLLHSEIWLFKVLLLLKMWWTFHYSNYLFHYSNYLYNALTDQYSPMRCWQSLTALSPRQNLLANYFKHLTIRWVIIWVLLCALIAPMDCFHWLFDWLLINWTLYNGGLDCDSKWNLKANFLKQDCHDFFNFIIQ